MRVSITLLQYEHGVIRQVLDCLKEIVEKDLLDMHEPAATEIVIFLLNYMDDFHHRKEERFVFPAVSSNDRGLEELTAELFRDHEKARTLLSNLSDLVKGDSVTDRGRFLREGRELVTHVTAHISQEEDRAFPLFEEVLSVEEDSEISQRYEEFTIMNFEEDFLRKSEDFAFRIENQVLGPGYYEGVA